MTFYDISHLDSVRSALNIQASGQPLRKGHCVKAGGPRIKSSLRRSPCDITSPAGKTTFLLPKIPFQTSGYSSGAEVKVRLSIETRGKTCHGAARPWSNYVSLVPSLQARRECA